jgi:hypothetical protein
MFGDVVLGIDHDLFEHEVRCKGPHLIMTRLQAGCWAWLGWSMESVVAPELNVHSAG